jgi:hypothetical protein
MNIHKFAPIAILISVALARVPMTAGSALALHVSPTAAAGPVTIRIRLIVEHDSRNRTLEVSADSEGFYQSSEIELAGDEAPKTNEVVFRDMPQGSYEIVARLMDLSGHVRAVERNTVMITGSVGGVGNSSRPGHFDLRHVVAKTYSGR